MKVTDAFLQEFCYNCIHSIYYKTTHRVEIRCLDHIDQCAKIDEPRRHKQATGEALVDKIIEFRFGGGQRA